MIYSIPRWIDDKTALIDGPTLTTQVNGDIFEFLNPEYFAALGDGVMVDFAFDPAEPTLGAAIYDTKGFLCWASYLPAGPVISARDRTDDPSVQLIKRYKLAHRTAARMLDFKTLRTVKTAERRDGSGQVATATNRQSGLTSAATRVLPNRLEMSRRAAAGVDETEFERQIERTARDDARAARRALRVETPVYDE